MMWSLRTSASAESTRACLTLSGLRMMGVGMNLSPRSRTRCWSSVRSVLERFRTPLLILGLCGRGLGGGPAPYVGSSGLGGGGDQGPPSSISVRMPMSMDEAYMARCPHSSMGRLESLEEVVEALSSALSLSCPSSS